MDLIQDVIGKALVTVFVMYMIGYAILRTAEALAKGGGSEAAGSGSAGGAAAGRGSMGHALQRRRDGHWDAPLWGAAAGVGAAAKAAKAGYDRLKGRGDAKDTPEEPFVFDDEQRPEGAEPGTEDAPKQGARGGQGDAPRGKRPGWTPPQDEYDVTVVGTRRADAPGEVGRGPRQLEPPRPEAPPSPRPPDPAGPAGGPQGPATGPGELGGPVFERLERLTPGPAPTATAIPQTAPAPAAQVVAERIDTPSTPPAATTPLAGATWPGLTPLPRTEDPSRTQGDDMAAKYSLVPGVNAPARTAGGGLAHGGATGSHEDDKDYNRKVFRNADDGAAVASGAAQGFSRLAAAAGNAYDRMVEAGIGGPVAAEWGEVVGLMAEANLLAHALEAKADEAAKAAQAAFRRQVRVGDNVQDAVTAARGSVARDTRYYGARGNS
ncbi:hypothetical protein AB0395_22000 [Streptosporangium sp. NPDC051023]|uniref:hypothetical protein n=1 Tax=Streptosporangium sp. NPDC051023 TaxID=3155410 RepID=UPI00344EF215